MLPILHRHSSYRTHPCLESRVIHVIWHILIGLQYNVTEMIFPNVFKTMLLHNHCILPYLYTLEIQVSSDDSTGANCYVFFLMEFHINSYH